MNNQMAFYIAKHIYIKILTNKLPTENPYTPTLTVFQKSSY